MLEQKIKDIVHKLNRSRIGLVELSEMYDIAKCDFELYLSDMAIKNPESYRLVYQDSIHNQRQFITFFNFKKNFERIHQRRRHRLRCGLRTGFFLR